MTILRYEGDRFGVAKVDREITMMLQPATALDRTPVLGITIMRTVSMDGQPEDAGHYDILLTPGNVRRLLHGWPFGLK